MLDLSRQFAPLRQEILDAIAQVCDAQQFILGPRVEAFEAVAAGACNSSFAVGCASGTDAIWLALAAAGIGDSSRAARTSGPLDGVITTPFSFFASASAILRAGARPLFADIDPRTFNLSPDSVAELLRSPSCPPVQAVMPVHLFGQCADWDAFEAIQRDRPSLVLLEDAAQAFGAAWTSSNQTTPGQPSRRAGSLGLAAAFSFYPTKNLSAFGDAGLVTTSDPALAEHARSLRNHGLRTQGTVRRYYHDELGWNSRLDAIQAAVLEVKLRHLPRWNQQRRDRAARYDALFRAAGLAAPKPGGPSFPVSSERVGSTATESRIVTPSTGDGIVLPYTDPRATPIFHQYVIRAPRRDALRAHLTALHIGSQIYYPVPLHLQPALKDLGYKSGDFPHAELAAAEVLALPIYPELRDDEQEAVVEAIRDFYA